MDLDAVQKKIVILISGRGSNLGAIIKFVSNKKINANITCVISNNAEAKGLIVAKSAGINILTIGESGFEHQLLKTIKEYDPDLIALAGFMYILSDEFVSEFPDKIINIHPSLLPKYKGLNTHGRVLSNKESEHGCSVHVVTNELDAGPLIMQARVTVEKDDDLESLADKVLQKEHIIYPLVLQLLCQGRIEIKGNKVFYDNKKIAKPIICN